ncbi:MAG: pyridoxal phosphate-dependent aminotransferase [Clostridia bacterium]|nr:pyridoxal phosphate-dependent aminotransferase [Clostridia bacterium]
MPEHFHFHEQPDRAGTGSTKWEQSKGAIPMWIADMDFYSAPCVRDALLLAARESVYGYTDATDAYFEAVQGWMRRRHHFHADREWIMPQNGVTPSIAACIRGFTAPGDRVLLQPPLYPPFIHLTERNGREPVYNPLQRDEAGIYRMDFDDLERKARDPRAKMMLLCSPHNPTGRVWTPEELSKVAEICARNGVIVVSDEIHSDLILAGRHTMFCGVAGDVSDRCAILTAPSKTFNLAGLQLSNTIIPGTALRDRYRNEQIADGYEHPSFFGSRALIAAYTQGDEWLDAVRAYIRDNFALLKDCFGARLPTVRLTDAQATYLAWTDWNALRMPPGELQRIIREEAGVYVMDGAQFGIGGEGFLRMNLAMPRGELEQALQRIWKRFA